MPSLRFFPRRSVARFASFVGLGASLLSCAENRSSLFIIGVLAPEAPVCTFTPSTSASLFLKGTLDVAFTYEYRAGLLVGSQLVQRGDPDTLRTEVNRLSLEGAEVELSDFEGRLDDGFFTVPGAGFVDAASGTTPSLGVFGATLIPDVVGFRLSEQLQADGLGASKEVIANVRVFGRTLGGVSIDSAEFTFPIEVCLGCLVAYPLEAIDFDGQGKPVCQGNPESAGAETCSPGQDQTVDCRHCASTVPVCSSPTSD